IPSKMFQSEHSSRRVVAVWDTTWQVRPAPTAWRSSRVGMSFLELLSKQPVHQLSSPIEIVQLSGNGQSVDRKRRHPRLHAAVNWPAAVGPHRLPQKLDALACHRMFRVPDARQAECDEARQRDRLQEAAARRLYPLQHTQTATARQPTDEAGNRVPR